MKTAEEVLKSKASFEFEAWKKDHPDQLKLLEIAMNEYASLKVEEAKEILKTKLVNRLSDNGLNDRAKKSMSIAELALAEEHKYVISLIEHL